MTTESTRLRELAAICTAKARTAHAAYSAAQRPDGPYQNSRYSPYLSGSALFHASVDAEARLSKAATIAKDFERDFECESDWTLTDLKDFAVRVATYHLALDKAEIALRRAIEVENAVEAAKFAASKSNVAIAAEVEAVWKVRNTFCGKDMRAFLGIPR